MEKLPSNGEIEMNQSKNIDVMRLLVIIISIIIAVQPVLSLNTQSGIFRKDVKTLQIHNPENFMAPAVIRMGTPDRLDINFDIIGEQHEYLRYKLLHCNADWQPSRLLESEYLGAFNEGEIVDYAYSTNTFVHYVNYNLEIPSADLPIIASGNYLLQVYPENDPDEIILQVRFSVAENSGTISGGVTTRTDKGFNSEFQQLYLSVNPGNITTLNPYQDLIVSVSQNNRSETERIITHPMRVEGGNVIYEHDMNLIFDAGNEYRRFETVRVDYPGMHVDSVKFGGTNWHAWLAVDDPRNEQEYFFDSTQNGRFKVDEYNATDPDLGADYVTVHFTLDAPEVIDGDVYIDGDFALEGFRMDYDREQRVYTAQIPLKQGSYNYQYLVRPKSGGKGVTGVFEGNKYETRNEYLVRVFIREPGSRADRLISAVTLLSSGLHR